MGEGECVVLDVSNLLVLGEVVDELVEVGLRRCFDFCRRDGVGAQNFVAHHPVLVTGDDSIDRIANNAEAMQRLHQLLGLLCKRDGRIKIVNVVTLAIDDETQGAFVVSYFVESAIIFEAKHCLFYRCACALGR